MMQHLRRNAQGGAAAAHLWLHTVIYHLEHGDHPDRRYMSLQPEKVSVTRSARNKFGYFPLSTKSLAQILLDSVRQKLLTHQRHYQYGFTPKKSTVDRDLAFRVLIERLRDFRTGLLAASPQCGSPQGVRLGEPICISENCGVPQSTPKLHQPDIRPVLSRKSALSYTTQLMLGYFTDTVYPNTF